MSIWPFKEEWHGIQWRELSGDISETVTMGSLMHVLVTVLSLTPSSHMTYPHNQIIKSIWENLNLAKWNATIHSLIYFTFPCCCGCCWASSLVELEWSRLQVFSWPHISTRLLKSKLSEAVVNLSLHSIQSRIVLLLFVLQNVRINMFVSRLNTFTSFPA